MPIPTDFVVEHVVGTLEVVGRAPGFVLCVDDGLASAQVVGETPLYLVDSTTYATEVLQ